MMKKKPVKKTGNNKPLRRQSFSDFSQSYAGGLNRNKLSYGDRVRRRKKITRILLVLAFIAIFIAGYLIISIMLDLSKTPAESAPASIARVFLPFIN